MDLPFRRPKTPEEIAAKNAALAQKERAAAAKKLADEARAKREEANRIVRLQEQEERMRIANEKREAEAKIKEENRIAEAKRKADEEVAKKKQKEHLQELLANEVASKTASGGFTSIGARIRHPLITRKQKQAGIVYDASAAKAKVLTIEERMQKLDLERALKESRASTQLFDRDKMVKGAKKYSAIILIIILLALPVGIFFYVNSANHTGPFSYQLESYYGPFFSQISSFITPLFSLISNELTCVANPVNCVGTHNSNQTQQVYTTFTSFLSTQPSQNPQTIFLTSSSGNTLGQLFYTVQNTANVPLGSGTSNDILLNESCGSNNDPAATINCVGTTPQSPAFVENGVQLLPVIFTQQTIENRTDLSVQCPWNPNVQLNSIASLQLNFTVKNYSAATIFPIQFMDSTFYQQLVSSQQTFNPTQPSISFVSPGPVQVTLSTTEPQPIVTDTGNMPISIAVSQEAGAGGTFHINSLSIFIPKSLWSSAPSSSGWSCSTSNGGRSQQFILPGNNYWNCTSQLGDAIQQGGAQFTLPQVLSLNGEHFNSVPLLAYINYNYYQSMDMPFIVRTGGGVSCP